MRENVAQILDRLGELSQKERAELAYAIICSLEPQDEDVGEAWNAELSERVAEVRAGRVIGKLAEQLFAELREDRS
jgi:putative addiction module component (TIGR02574 family)